MRTLAALIILSFCGCGEATPEPDATPDGDTATGVGDTTNHALCPEDHPSFLPVGTPLGCSPGLTCRWPAHACAPGEKPDNVCTCEASGWRCEGHTRNCLPPGAPFPEGQLHDGVRPTPPHRPSAETCADPADEPRDTSLCTSRPNGRGECTRHADCEAEALCLNRYDSLGLTRCTCTVAGCTSDADCPSGTLCACGSLDNTQACEGPYRVGCSHRCLPAHCRTDADCGPGRLCSPSRDDCGWEVERWACHDPARDECLSDAECAFTKGYGSFCQARPDGIEWRCVERPLCD